MGKNISIRSFAKMLTRYLKGSSSDEEKRQVLNWLENRGRGSDFSVSDEEKKAIEMSLWKGIQDKVKNRRYDAGRSLTGNNAAWRIAAAISFLAVLSALWYFAGPNPSEKVSTASLVDDSLRAITNNGAASKEIILSDGSHILLQPGSSLSYNNIESGPMRIVQLKGEAFFDVARDPSRPFVVHSSGIVTTVLGTSFIIESPGGDKPTVVTVKTGLVKVAKSGGLKNQDDEDIMLRPNEKAIFETKSSPVVVKTDEKIPDWVEPNDEVVKIYDGVSLSAILLDIERQFNVDIEFDPGKLTACKISTEFSIEGVEERLEILARTFNGSFKDEADRFLFESEGCK